MKKGATHVDWAVSLGIFLIYLLSLLIIIRPGFTPLYTGDVLVSIIEDGLDKEVYWNITKVPLFVRMDNVGGNVYNINITDFKLKWNETTLFNDEDFFLADNQRRILNFSLVGNQLKFTAIESFKEKKTYIFWLTYSGEGGYENTPFTPGEFVAPEKYTFDYGTAEEIDGISLDRFMDLGDTDEMKTRWNYPKEKDFAISLINTSKTAYTLSDIAYNYSSGDVYEQTDVFVKERKDDVVDKYGNRGLVTVNIKVW